LFQIDHKKFEDSDLGYLNLPSTREELTEGQKPQHGGMTLSSKDSFTIHTNVCSTKLTQNGNLISFRIRYLKVLVFRCHIPEMWFSSASVLYLQFQIQYNVLVLEYVCFVVLHFILFLGTGWEFHPIAVDVRMLKDCT
jgi:hypothetical protein